MDDLLTLAQLESSSPNLQLSNVRLADLFAAIVRDWGKRFAEKKIGIEVKIPADLPSLRADETRLQEILYNLLDNALKYTEPGGKIRLMAEQHNQEIAVSVSDTGIGIPEEDLAPVRNDFIAPTRRAAAKWAARVLVSPS